MVAFEGGVKAGACRKDVRQRRVPIEGSERTTQGGRDSQGGHGDREPLDFLWLLRAQRAG